MTPNTLRELLAAATTGEWSVYLDARGRVSKIDGWGGRVCTFQPSDKNGQANARLIVALRNAAPALLARLEAAEAVVEAAREMVSERVVRRGPDDLPAPVQAPDIRAVLQALRAYDPAKE